MSSPNFYLQFNPNKYGGSTLNITGDFRSGQLLHSATYFINTVVLAYKEVEIDLTGVVFMDSDSMNLIKSLENKANVLWDTESYVYKRYKDKFND